MIKVYHVPEIRTLVSNEILKRPEYNLSSMRGMEKHLDTILEKNVALFWMKM